MSNNTVSKTISKIFNDAFTKQGVVTFNSSKSEFCFNKKVGKSQRLALEAIKQEYGIVVINNVEWNVKVRFHWSKQMPAYFYGYKR